METKERNKGFGEYQGKKSGWCGVLGRQEQRTKQGSTASARQPWLDLGRQTKGRDSGESGNPPFMFG